MLILLEATYAQNQGSYELDLTVFKKELGQQQRIIIENSTKTKQAISTYKFLYSVMAFSVVFGLISIVCSIFERLRIACIPSLLMSLVALTVSLVLKNYAFNTVDLFQITNSSEAVNKQIEDLQKQIDQLPNIEEKNKMIEKINQLFNGLNSSLQTNDISQSADILAKINLSFVSSDPNVTNRLSRIVLDPSISQIIQNNANAQIGQQIQDISAEIKYVDEILNVFVTKGFILETEIPQTNSEKCIFLLGKLSELNKWIENNKGALQELRTSIKNNDPNPSSSKISTDANDINGLLKDYFYALDGFLLDYKKNKIDPIKQDVDLAISIINNSVGITITPAQLTEVINSINDVGKNSYDSSTDFGIAALSLSLSTGAQLNLAVLTQQTTEYLTKNATNVAQLAAIKTQLLPAKQMEYKQIEQVALPSSEAVRDAAKQQVLELNSIYSGITNYISSKGSFTSTMSNFQKLETVKSMLPADSAQTAAALSDPNFASSFLELWQDYFDSRDSILYFLKTNMKNLQTLTGYTTLTATNMNNAIYWLTCGAKQLATIPKGLEQLGNTTTFKSFFDLYNISTAGAIKSTSINKANPLTVLSPIFAALDNSLRIFKENWSNQLDIDFFNNEYGTGITPNGNVDNNRNNSYQAANVAGAALSPLTDSSNVKDITKRFMRISYNFYRFFRYGMVPYECFPWEEVRDGSLATIASASLNNSLSLLSGGIKLGHISPTYKEPCNTRWEFMSTKAFMNGFYTSSTLGAQPTTEADDYRMIKNAAIAATGYRIINDYSSYTSNINYNNPDFVNSSWAYLKRYTSSYLGGINNNNLQFTTDLRSFAGESSPTTPYSLFYTIDGNPLNSKKSALSGIMGFEISTIPIGYNLANGLSSYATLANKSYSIGLLADPRNGTQRNLFHLKSARKPWMTKPVTFNQEEILDTRNYFNTNITGAISLTTDNPLNPPVSFDMITSSSVMNTRVMPTVSYMQDIPYRVEYSFVSTKALFMTFFKVVKAMKYVYDKRMNDIYTQLGAKTPDPIKYEDLPKIGLFSYLNDLIVVPEISTISKSTPINDAYSGQSIFYDNVNSSNRDYYGQQNSALFGDAASGIWTNFHTTPFITALGNINNCSYGAMRIENNSGSYNNLGRSTLNINSSNFSNTNEIIASLYKTGTYAPAFSAVYNNGIPTYSYANPITFNVWYNRHLVPVVYSRPLGSEDASAWTTVSSTSSLYNSLTRPKYSVSSLVQLCNKTNSENISPALNEDAGNVLPNVFGYYRAYITNGPLQAGGILYDNTWTEN